MKKNSLNCDIVPKGGWVKVSKPHFFQNRNVDKDLGWVAQKLICSHLKKLFNIKNMLKLGQKSSQFL